MRHVRTRRSGTIFLAVLAAGLPLRAADPEPTFTGELLVGGQYFSDDPSDPAKFLEYRDVPNGLVVPELRFTWLPAGRAYVDFAARDLSQGDQRVALGLGRRDLWKVQGSWAENPRRWTDRARTLYAHRGGAVFTLDDTLQAAVQAAPASADADADGEWDAGTKGFLIKGAIAEASQDVAVRLQRTTAVLGAEYTPTRHLTFGVAGQRERRSGTAPQSLGNYFTLSPSEVAAPTDLRTDELSGYAEYASRRFNVGAEVASSRFETGFKPLVWDNQLFLADGVVNPTTANPGHGRLLLFADSDLTRWTLHGGVNLPRRTRVQATVSRAETTQDDAFLPMTINSLLAAAPLPDDSFDGKYENNLYDLSVTTKPLRWLSLRAYFRDYEQANESPSLRFADYVMTDYQFPTCANANACGAAGARIQRRSLPYGYEKTRQGLSAGFSPLDWLDLGLGYELLETDREFSAVESADEDVWKATADVDVAEWLSLRATYRLQERRADEYDAHYLEHSFPIGEPYVAGFNEGMRRFYWTDRDRDAWTLLLDVTPRPDLSFYGEATRIEDEYFDPETGLRIGDSFTVQEDRNFDSVPETYELLLAGRTEDESTTYTLGVAWTPSDRFDLFADYTWDEFTWTLASRYRAPVANIGSDNPLDDWGSDVEDSYDTWTFGFRAAFAEKTWDLTGSLSQSDGTGEIRNNFVPGGAAAGDTTLLEFPTLTSDLTLGTLSLVRHVGASLDVGLHYWYERWDEDNWASDFMRPYMGDPTNDPGSAQAIYLGMDYESYKTNVVTFSVRYRYD